MTVVCIRNHKNYVARFGFGLVENRLHLRLGHELRERASHAVRIHANPGKSLCTDALDKLGQLVNLFSRERFCGIFRS